MLVFFADPADAFKSGEILSVITPAQTSLYNELYYRWKEALEKQLSSVKN